jgi:hypothetical protein
VTEHTSWELLEKITAIICEEWPEQQGEYLQSATIYERLTNEGIEVADRFIGGLLLKLANDGQIEVVMVDELTDEEIRTHGGMTIQGVSPDVCP